MGNPYPAYFLSWGSGQNTLLAYLSMPVVESIWTDCFFNPACVSKQLSRQSIKIGIAVLLAMESFPAIRYYSPDSFQREAV